MVAVSSPHHGGDGVARDLTHTEKVLSVKVEKREI